MRGPKWSAEAHSFVRGSFRLDPGFNKRLKKVYIEFSAGNVVPPNYLRIQINQRNFEFRVDPTNSPYSGWSPNRLRQYWVTQEIPLDILRDGNNHLLVTAETLQGLARIHPLNFDSLSLKLVH